MKNSFNIIEKHNYYAFTLAEVLITLGIIGVVAAMTLPTLINNNMNKQLEAGLKRSYSLIGQALDMYQAENGERIKQGEVGYQELKGLIIPYFRVVRDCAMGNDLAASNNVGAACIKNFVSNSKEESSTNYKTYNKKANIYLNYFDNGQFVINDGTLILIENFQDSLYISVDVNGYNKRPNLLGHDLFMFMINEKGDLLPMGVSGTKYYDKNDAFCSKTSNSNMNGAGCTYKALSDNNYFKNLPR